MRSTANNWFAQQRKNKLLKQILLNGGEDQKEQGALSETEMLKNTNLKRKASASIGMGARVSSQKVMAFDNTSIASEEPTNGET